MLTDLKADAETLPLDPVKEDWIGHKVGISLSFVMKQTPCIPMMQLSLLRGILLQHHTTLDKMECCDCKLDRLGNNLIQVNERILNRT